jgi:hypothetical protein
MYRAIIAILPAIFLVACSSSQHRTARLLDQRLEARLAADVVAGRAVVQQLPDGARVTLLSPASFPNGPMALDDSNPDIRASVIEGLLDPRLMRIAVADTTTLPDEQRQTRIRNIETYFADFGLADTAPGTGTAPAGLTITVGVQCPKPYGPTDYGSVKSGAVCD